MAVKSTDQVTLTLVKDISAVNRYYLLQSATLEKPSKPTTNPPPVEWSVQEPAYEENQNGVLYTVELNIYSDDSWSYSEVQVSSSYSAAKDALVKANQYTNSELVDKADEIINDVQSNTEKFIENQNFPQKSDLSDLETKLSNTIGATDMKLSGNMDTLKEQIEQIDKSLAERDEFIRIDGVDIILGKIDSPYSARFSNESLKFMYNNQVVAEFTNDNLVVNSVAASNQVRIGPWGMRLGKADNLNVIWIGG